MYIYIYTHTQGFTLQLMQIYLTGVQGTQCFHVHHNGNLHKFMLDVIYQTRF